MELTPTIVNVVVFGVILISAMLAYSRGLTREAVTLGVWIGAALVALNYYQVLIDPVRGFQDFGDWNKWIALGVAFVIALILLSMMGAAISSLIGRSPFRAIDKGLGFVFGAARGLLILAVCWIGYNAIVKPEYTHLAIEASKGGQLVDDSADYLMTLAPDDWPDFIKIAAEDLIGENGEDEIITDPPPETPLPAASEATDS